jgi:hypothetical protein
MLRFLRGVALVNLGLAAVTVVKLAVIGIRVRFKPLTQPDSRVDEAR